MIESSEMNLLPGKKPIRITGACNLLLTGTINMVKTQNVNLPVMILRLPRTFLNFSLTAACKFDVRCIEVLVNIYVPTKGSNHCAADFACD